MKACTGWFKLLLTMTSQGERVRAILILFDIFNNRVRPMCGAEKDEK